MHERSTMSLTTCNVAVQAPVLLSQEKVHARVAVPTKAHVLLVSPTVLY